MPFFAKFFATMPNFWPQIATMNTKKDKAPRTAGSLDTNSSQTSSDRGRREEKGLETQWIRLNFGGKIFLTTHRSLTKDPESLLFRLCQVNSNLEFQKDETWAYLIDRNPSYFVPILDYLRHGNLLIDENVSEEGLLVEAEFFNMKNLMKLIKERIQQRDRTEELVKTFLRQQINKQEYVYRTLQFNEDEIASMDSTLSDGWKIEHLTNFGSQNGGNSKCQEFGLPRPGSLKLKKPGKKEFLCVVSKEIEDTENCRTRTQDDVLPCRICPTKRFIKQHSSISSTKTI